VNFHPLLVITMLSIFFPFSQLMSVHTISEEVFSKITSNEEYCVKVYGEDRIYLHAKNIHVTDNGLFLRINDNEMVRLNALISDSSGCSVTTDGWRIEVFNFCPQCGKRYFVRCKNPDCPSNKK
jgi:hypothetical protein